MKGMRRLLGLPLLAASLTAAPSSGAPQRADTIDLDVVAVDRRAQPVIDLKPGELEVWINDFRIPIQTVSFVSPQSGGRGTTIVLVLDDMSVHPASVPRIRDAAKRFVERLQPGDQVAVVSLNGDAMKATADRAALLKAIDQHHSQSLPIRFDHAAQHVFRTVTALARQIAEAPGGRKAIVMIGSGWLFDRPVPPPTASIDLRPDWVDAMRATANAHASVYVIDPAGVGTAPVTGGSSGFARETGGFAFMNTNDLAGVADRILSELRTYYVLTVENPPVGKKAELREVRVKVQRRGVTVRARRGIAAAR